MRSTDLRRVKPPPGCPVSIFSRVTITCSQVCAQCLAGRRRECRVRRTLPVSKPLLRPTHLADEPLADFTPVLSWLRATVPGHSVHRSRPPTSTSAVVLRHHRTVSRRRFVLVPITGLFGMLCRPSRECVVRSRRRHRQYWRDPHHGFARFASSSRAALAAGIASFRIDFAGPRATA